MRNIFAGTDPRVPLREAEVVRNPAGASDQRTMTLQASGGHSASG